MWLWPKIYEHVLFSLNVQSLGYKLIFLMYSRSSLLKCVECNLTTTESLSTDLFITKNLIYMTNCTIWITTSTNILSKRIINRFMFTPKVTSTLWEADLGPTIWLESGFTLAKNNGLVLFSFLKRSVVGIHIC